jgi:hypothetical protein
MPEFHTWQRDFQAPVGGRPLDSAGPTPHHSPGLLDTGATLRLRSLGSVAALWLGLLGPTSVLTAAAGEPIRLSLGATFNGSARLRETLSLSRWTWTWAPDHRLGLDLESQPAPNPCRRRSLRLPRHAPSRVGHCHSTGPRGASRRRSCGSAGGSHPAPPGPTAGTPLCRWLRRLCQCPQGRHEAASLLLPGDGEHGGALTMACSWRSRLFRLE